MPAWEGISVLEIFYPRTLLLEAITGLQWMKKPVDGGYAKLETFEKVSRSVVSFQLNAVVAEVILNSPSPTLQRTLGPI